RFAAESAGTPKEIGDELRSLLSVTGALAEIRGRDGVLFRSPEFQETGRGFRTMHGRVRAAAGETYEASFALPDVSYREPLRQLRLYYALLCLPGLALASLGSYYLARRALRPVEEIRRQAERISRANLSERVQIPSSRDEIHDLARTFNEMLDRLEAAVEDLRNLAADAAHELRTPLANLRAEIDTAVQEPHSSEEHEQVLMSVADEVARMTRIVSDLFTLARMDLRQHALEKRRIDLRPLLEEARETWTAAADARRIEIRVEGSEAPIQGDASAVSRIFMNLVENAVKYNRDGGRVVLSLRREADAVQVQVADTGIGIEAEHLPKLFRRFYRTDKARSRETGGAGLGLAIAKSFTEALGGTIGVRSAPDVGTTFTLVFPAAGDGQSN
ncbi:MAG: HAMP domain-containing protein, partial [Planctomycetaceae bacterium]|nr:HAMP domain-containing protein [Planctomycetaceae bacterium]